MGAPADSILPKVIVGLGNPGDEYAGTRHNAGFMVVDRILEKLNKPNRREHRYDSEIVRVTFGGRQLILVKPLTFMNLSGTAVAKGRAAWDAVPEEILAVYDCLDLPAGKIRLRQDGGSGGHRGVESMIRELGSQKFPRLRVGIGRQTGKPVVDYVLSGWTEEEQPLIEQAVDAAADAVILAVRSGMAMAMNRYNGWSAKVADSDKPAGEKKT